MPENNGKQNSNGSYTNKCQKHITCSYGYKLVCIDDKFSKPFKTNLGEDAIYNFIDSMIEESKYCKDVMRKHFNKELVITEDLWICDNDHIDTDLKVRDHCHITGKYRGSALSDCNINFKSQNSYCISQPKKI